MTQDMMRISIQVKGVVVIRNSCEGWSWVVMLGSSDVPPNRSTAFRTSRHRKITKDAAWATNFRKGPHMSFPNWKHTQDTEQSLTLNHTKNKSIYIAVSSSMLQHMLNHSPKPAEHLFSLICWFTTLGVISVFQLPDITLHALYFVFLFII